MVISNPGEASPYAHHTSPVAPVPAGPELRPPGCRRPARPLDHFALYRLAVPWPSGVLPGRHRGSTFHAEFI
jgi:hypothetical protein